MLTEQRVRIAGGRKSARGATVRWKMNLRTEKICSKIDDGRQKPKLYFVNRSELVFLLNQAKEAWDNFPESVAAQKRYQQLLAQWNQKRM